jgi:DNA primase
VSPSKGIFKCFGCGEGGNAINFIMKHEHLTYPEAIRYVAKKYNIEIEEKAESEEERKARDERESLMAVVAFAQKHFTKNLMESSEGRSVGLSYLHERGFNKKTIETFQLGYSPDKWDDLTKIALENGYRKEFLEKAGLSVVKPNHVYDKFRSRVIFPIQNLSGRTIGFGGRILGKTDKQAKYLNSPESVIYNKSQVLYGIYFAKSEIVKQDRCYLVEGYTDVLSLFQAGIENVVASSGTSLTTGQIRLIKRYTNNVTILYDGDPAGIKASLRGIDMFLETGINVRVVLFPKGEDPDSFARNHTTSETKSYIESHSEDFITFKAKLLLHDTGEDPIARANAIDAIARSIATIPNLLQREEYIRSTWEKLGVDQQNLTYRINALRADNRKVQQKREEFQVASKPAAQPAKQVSVMADEHIEEKELIRLLIKHGRVLILIKTELGPSSISVAEYILNEIFSHHFRFHNPVYEEIIMLVKEQLEADFIPDETFFLRHEKENISQTAIDLTTTRDSISKNWFEQKGIRISTEEDHLKELAESLIWDFQLKDIEAQIRDLQKSIQSVTGEDYEALLETYRTLSQKRAAIHKKRGRIIFK